jgi:hypothetical protein
MENKILNFQLKNKIKEWENEFIPLKEILEFYTLDEILNSNIIEKLDKPYVWSMSVSSIDGITSFQEKGETSSKEIALDNIENSGSKVDWRLLNAGWMV